jgi:DNA (cytosine-5)-methyltransferase 1
VLAAVECDSFAAATYKLNNRRTKVYEDDIQSLSPANIRTASKLEKGELDLLAGCPPCQGFSSLRTFNGGKTVDEPMNDLVFSVLPFVEEFEPRAIMLENVPGLAEDPRVELLIERLAALGYKAERRVLDAVDFGVPQRRKRMILVAIKGGVPIFAAPLSRKRTVRSAIGSLHRPGEGSDTFHDYMRAHSSETIELFERIPADGGSRRDLSSNDQLPCHRKCDGFKDVYGRMHWRRPAPTITGGCINPSKGRFLHPEQHRAITLREASLLQGFPRSFKFSAERGRFPIAQLIGNAFPPRFAELHAKAILEAISR